MADTTIKFSIKYKKSPKSAEAQKPLWKSKISALAKISFSQLKIYPENALEFQIKDQKFNVWHRIENYKAIPDQGAVIKIVILEDFVPLKFFLNNFRELSPKGPFDSNKTVRLRGLPWECDEDDIFEFFEGLKISRGGVHINYTDPSSNRHSGDGYVEFEEKESVEKALEKAHQCILERYIEIFPSSEEEIFTFRKRQFELARFSSESVPVDEKSVVLKMIGLPWEASYSDILDFLVDTPLTAIHFPKNRQGRSSGTAYVEMLNGEFASRVLGHQKEYIGDRFIEIKMSNMRNLRSDMDVPENSPNPQKTKNSRATSKAIKEMSESPSDKTLPEPTAKAALRKTYCVLIRNLQSETTNYAIDNFFASNGIPPYRIHKRVNGMEAYCEFSTSDDCEMALDLTGRLLEGCEVVISRVSFDEVAEHVGLTHLRD